jgi:hypothetical protein
MSTQFEDLLRDLGNACQEYVDLRNKVGNDFLDAEGKPKTDLERVTDNRNIDLKELDVFYKAMDLCQGPGWKEKLKYYCR